jgi:hypothetical protein
MYDQDLLALYIILIFVAFIAGFFLGASPKRHDARRPGRARLAVADGEPRHDGKGRSIKLPFVMAALAVAGAVIIADHLKGPMFTDVAYCLNDGGAQTTRMCTARVPP